MRDFEQVKLSSRSAKLFVGLMVLLVVAAVAGSLGLMSFADEDGLKAKAAVAGDMASGAIPFSLGEPSVVSDEAQSREAVLVGDCPIMVLPNNGSVPPVNFPFRRAARSLSRVRSETISRSNCAKDKSMLSVRRPIEVEA